MTDRLYTDTLIIGAGSAGCVIANRLSANSHHQVTLVEAGGKDSWHWIHIPVGYLYTMGNPKTDWCYSTTPQQGLNGRSLAYPRGRVLGGCSSINGMIYMRGQKDDYESWGEGWSWEDVLTYYKKSENYHRGADDYHSDQGEMLVQEQRLKWEVLETFKKVCEESGFNDKPDFNRGDNSGVGYFEVTQKKGVRWSSARAFLHPVTHRPNLRVMTKTLTERLIFEGNRCIGMEGTCRGNPVSIQAKRVVLAAGAVGSPSLLERSGIGSESVLKPLGIPIRNRLEGVGKNLQDHLQVRLQYRLEASETLNQQASSWLGRMKMGLQYAYNQSGPLSMAPSQLGAFFKSGDDVDRADLEFHIQPMSADKLGTDLHPFPGMTASVCHLRPESRGTIHISGTKASDAPIINPNYLSETYDREVVCRAIKKTRDLMDHPLLAKFSPSEHKPGRTQKTDHDLVTAAGDVATTIFHPVGTAKMGPDTDDYAVVSRKLGVYGVRDLYIADASIVPTITSGNTHAPVVMIAERLAEWLD